MNIGSIEMEIENIEELLNKFPQKSVTDIWFDDRFKALKNYLKLLKEHKNLIIKYSNVENELLARTDKLREYSKELNLKNRIRSIQDTMLDEVKA